MKDKLTEFLSIESNLAAADVYDKSKAKIRPPGYEKIQEFCDAVDASKTPDIELLTEISAAFKEILNEHNRVKALAAFGREIGLNEKRGVKLGNMRQQMLALNNKAEAVYMYFKLIESHQEKFAATEVATEFGVSISLVREWAATESVMNLYKFFKPLLDDICQKSSS